ncbi:hypothetical protein ACP3V3_02385 [Vibrio sp. PNB22_3_1]
MRNFFLPGFILLGCIIIAGMAFALSPVLMFYFITFVAIFALPVPLFVIYRRLEGPAYDLHEWNECVQSRLHGDCRHLGFDNCKKASEHMLLKKFAFISQISSRQYKLAIFDRSEPMLAVRDDGDGAALVLFTTAALAARPQEELVVEAAIADLILLEHRKCEVDGFGYLGTAISTMFLYKRIDSLLKVSPSVRSFSPVDAGSLLRFED